MSSSTDEPFVSGNSPANLSFLYAEYTPKLAQVLLQIVENLPRPLHVVSFYSIYIISKIHTDVCARRGLFNDYRHTVYIYHKANP
jgi:hypothetical protein